MKNLVKSIVLGLTLSLSLNSLAADRTFLQSADKNMKRLVVLQEQLSKLTSKFFAKDIDFATFERESGKVKAEIDVISQSTQLQAQAASAKEDIRHQNAMARLAAQRAALGLNQGPSAVAESHDPEVTNVIAKIQAGEYMFASSIPSKFKSNEAIWIAAIRKGIPTFSSNIPKELKNSVAVWVAAIEKGIPSFSSSVPEEVRNHPAIKAAFAAR